MFISAEGELLMFRLAAWELLERDEYNPRDLLRALPLADLVIISKNITSRDGGFLSAGMVRVELMYREGQLLGDWTPSRDGARYTLSPFQSLQQGATA